MREAIIQKVKRQEFAKAIALTISSVVLLGIMGAVFVESTDITGISAATFSGNVTVDGECYLGGGIGCVPSGSILFFTTSCPTGWTRQTAFDSDHFYLASSSTVGGGGVSHSHSHTHGHLESLISSSAGSAHTHTNVMNGATNTFNHRHDASFYADEGDTGLRGYWTDGQWSGFTSVSHNHSFSAAGGSAGAAHSHSWSGTSSSTAASTTSTAWTVSYIDVVVCEKD